MVDHRKRVRLRKHECGWREHDENSFIQCKYICNNLVFMVIYGL